MRWADGGRLLERLAGPAPGGAPTTPSRWRTRRSGPDPWAPGPEAADEAWLRGRAPSLAREALQQGLLFPLARAAARPRVAGADELVHTPQPAVIVANHGSDIDTPLILAALPRAWRLRTLVGAASDRFYRRRLYALMSGLWVNAFPFDRSGELRGLAAAGELLREGYNVLLYPQATRSAGQIDGFRTGVARLCIATDSPLIPVHVGGTALIMPKDRGLIQRGRASVSFGRALYPRPEEPPAALIERTKAAIARLSHDARAS